MMMKKKGVLILNAGPPLLFSAQDKNSAAASCKLSHTKVNLIAQSILIVSSVALAFLIIGPILISVLNHDDASSAVASLHSRLNPKFNHHQTRQHDIFISVKTTKKFHRSRLDVILDTWFELAPREIWFFTDDRDERVSKRTDNHLLVTGCSSDHSRQALCCKMAAEFEAFLESDKRWFCHFDDDNYVNVPALVKRLRRFDHTQDWYLGKPSIAEPLQVLDRARNGNGRAKKLAFWFGTGGAGFCLSQSLAAKMAPIAGGGKFEDVADKIRLPDDVTVGYIAEHLLQTPLTVIEEFHSHLEPMRLVSDVDNQISFSYSSYGGESNVVSVEGDAKNNVDDPTRFKSLHCRLFPRVEWCRRHSPVIL